MADCSKCKNADRCEAWDADKVRRTGECEVYEPITNADKIRSMSDEELAEFLREIDNGHDITHGDYFHTKDGDFIFSRDDINAKMIQWLQSEAE